MIPYFLLESVELLFLGELEGKKNLDIKIFFRVMNCSYMLVTSTINYILLWYISILWCLPIHDCLYLLPYYIIETKKLSMLDYTEVLYTQSVKKIISWNIENTRSLMT